MNLSELVAIFIAWFARNGHLKANASESMSTDPMQLPCTLDWGSWDWSCTSAHSRPCEFRILPALAHLPVFEPGGGSLDSLPQTSHEVSRERPDFCRESRGEICGGRSVANFLCDILSAPRWIQFKFLADSKCSCKCHFCNMISSWNSEM